MGITNYTCNGKCSCCGECCSDILHLSDTEIKKIDNYIKDKNIKPSDYVDDSLDLRCPFRNDVLKICMIYEVRPDICRMFQCNRSPKDVRLVREVTNYMKKPRSLRLVFFNDNRNQKRLYDNYKIKVEGR